MEVNNYSNVFLGDVKLSMLENTKMGKNTDLGTLYIKDKKMKSRCNKQNYLIFSGGGSYDEATGLKTGVWVELYEHFYRLNFFLFQKEIFRLCLEESIKMV